MNITKLPYYLEDLNRLEEVELSTIQKLIDQYPYMQQLRFLAAKKAHQSNNDLRVEISEFAAMYSAHPQDLYERLVFQEKRIEVDSKDSQEDFEEKNLEDQSHTNTALGGSVLGGVLVADSISDRSNELTSIELDHKSTTDELVEEVSDVAQQQEVKEEIYESIENNDPQEEALQFQETVDIIVNEDEALQQSLEAEDLSGFSKWLLGKRHLLFEDEPLHKPKIQQIKKHKRVFVQKEEINEVPAPKSPGKTPKIKDKSDQINAQIASESLAELYVEQGYKKRAIAMYEKLRLIIPEKSAYFAAQIQKIKEN